MLTIDEVQVLGDITNTTWGKSSTSIAPTMSLKCTLIGDSILQISYKTVVTFASERSMREQMPALENDAVQATDRYLADIKKKFKDRVGKSLKTKVKTTIPSVEIINLQPHISPKRTAYYNYVTVLELV